MSAAAHFFLLSLPLFSLVLAGYLLACIPFWRARWTELAAKFIFSVALPVMLFQLISRRQSMSDVDARLLVAFFGGCLIVFFLGRIVAARSFKLDGVSQSIFAMGGVFSNNVMLGVPLASLTLGPASLPPVALVLVFNAFTLWTLASISVEWARHGSVSLAGLGKTALGVLRNPIVVSIMLGAAAGALDLRVAGSVGSMLDWIARMAGPGALFALGLGLAAYPLKQQWRQSAAISAIKLFVQPLVVWGLGVALGLPTLELKSVVLLASLAVGANVYLMALQFERLAGTVATSLVLSTMLASITTPLWLAVVSHFVDGRALQ
jgi:predicted permease